LEEEPVSEMRSAFLFSITQKPKGGTTMAETKKITGNEVEAVAVAKAAADATLNTLKDLGFDVESDSGKALGAYGLGGAFVSMCLVANIDPDRVLDVVWCERMLGALLGKLDAR